MTDNSKNILKLINLLNPLERNANSEGVDRSLEIIKNKLLKKSKIHNYRTGLQVEDWEVPKRWKLKNAVLKDENGQIITSSKINKLFVAPYSESVDGWFSKKEIAHHLFTRKDKPKSYLLEHRNTYDYNLNDWRITLPFSLWKKMKNKKYYIKIDVEWSKGNMKVLECFLPGKKKDIITFTGHIDELCNDDLSGCALGVELFRDLSKQKNRKYSYQLLLGPELYGFLFYVYFNTSKIKKTIGMVNLEQVGAGKEWILKKTLKENSFIDKALETSFKSSKIKFKINSFFDGYMNDEKIYSWPKIGIDSASIQRYPFKEYHTSDDTPKIIKRKYIEDSYLISSKFIQIIENNFTPIYKNYLPPWLTKRNLYIDFYTDKINNKKYNQDILYMINGKNTVLDISFKIGIDFFEILSFVNKLIEQKIVKKI